MIIQAELILLQKVREFIEADKQFNKFQYESKKPKTEEESLEFFAKMASLSFKAAVIRNELFSEMYDINDVQIIDPDAKRTYIMLRKNHKFPSIAFSEKAADLLNINVENEFEHLKTDLKSHIRDRFDDFFGEFTSWFDVSDYYYRKAQLGAIITSSKVPKNISRYFDEIKEAFAFGLDLSCISLSRALLEIALYDKLKKKGHFKSNKIMQIKIAKEDQLFRSIDLSYKYNFLSSFHKDLAHEVRKTGNNVLHIKDTEEYSVRGRALKTITDTVEIIEFLYK
jgi:hypothetical protein